MRAYKRKGIVLAGGSGTRLYPATRSVSKQLLPVYDKPMIYYPLSTLMLSGIQEFLIISTPQDTPRFESLLGNGSQYGVSIEYAVQMRPAGIAQALIIAEEFLDGSPSALILGDNLFYADQLAQRLQTAAAKADGAHIFAYPVADPERYGVAQLDSAGRVVALEEKPARPASNLAVTGLYMYDQHAPAMARLLEPSERGELEITDLNRMYLDAQRLHCTALGRGAAWLDTGTHESLLEASQFVHAIERRQGLKIACLEETAFRMGYLQAEDLLRAANDYGSSPYGVYLRQIAGEAAMVGAQS